MFYLTPFNLRIKKLSNEKEVVREGEGMGRMKGLVGGKSGLS